MPDGKIKPYITPEEEEHANRLFIYGLLIGTTILFAVLVYFYMYH